MVEPPDLTIRAAAEALRAGTITSSGLLDAVLDQASRTEAELHSYLTIDREGATAAAEAADIAFSRGEDRGLLQGIPVAVKDNMVTNGVETTAGSQVLSGYVPPYDATAVARLRTAGAVIVGKANLDEFAMGSSTENSAYGPTRNPWNTDRVPGGSSGGAAASVAAGSALASLGSDTGGSIRQPASLCGVVGMKPTYGLVSRYGLIAFASSLDQIGPIARTVDDAVTVLEAIAGHDPLDATSYRGQLPEFRAGIGRGVDGMRVGVVRELSGEGIDADVLDLRSLQPLDEAAILASLARTGRVVVADESTPRSSVASASAFAKPTIAGVSSVPARRRSSWLPPRICGARGVPERT